jgi:hypothetical protein
MRITEGIIMTIQALRGSFTLRCWRRLLLPALLLLSLGACREENTPAADTITVYKSATCQCCSVWAEHLRQAGFNVVTHDQEIDALNERRRDLGVPDALSSCHTASVNGYVIEGHVPAADIRKLLAERPVARGLAVPGMPVGSPGMEHGAHHQPYQTLLLQKDGTPRVYVEH